MQLGNIFSNARTNPNPNPNQNMISQFADFKKQMEGKDAEAIVKQLLKEGKMTQAQFERLKSQAQSLMTILR